MRRIGLLIAATCVLVWQVRGDAAASLAVFTFGPGVSTFGFSAPAGAVPAGQGIQVGSLITQTDVKTRWPDGSLRFGIVSARIPSAGGYSLTAASAAAGSFAPTWPTATVQLQIGGVPYTATLPAFSAADVWLDGPVVKETRAVIAPARADGGSHPTLQVIFDVRSYSGGGHKVDVCVQNVRDVAEMDLVNYDVTITLNGGIVFTKASVTQFSYTRWRRVFWIGASEAAVTPDFAPYYQSRALPMFLGSIDDVAYDTNGPAFDIMGFGLMNPFQPAAGGRPELGPFPASVAHYLIHKSPSQRAVVLKHGDLSGSWSHFIAKSDGRSLIRLDATPDFWLDVRGAASDRPKAPVVPWAEMGTIVFRGVRDSAPPTYPRTDAEHFPSTLYVPYVLTGDRYYLDALKLWANNMVLKFWPAQGYLKDGIDVSRKRGQGIMAYAWGGGVGGRGWAWPLREVVNAAIACPDADVDKTYFAAIVRNNLDWAAAYNAQANTTGVSEATGWEGDTSHGDRLLVSLWQSSYLAWAIDWAGQQGFDLGPSLAFRDRMIRSQINLLTHAAEGYDPMFGAPYYMQVGRRVNGVPQLFRTWPDLWAANQTNDAWLPANGRRPPVWTGYYAAETRMLVVMGVRENIPGAAAAMAWLDSYKDEYGNTILADLQRGRPHYAVTYDITQTSRIGKPKPRAPTSLRIVR